MTNVLILGASGQIARWVVRMLTARPDTYMTLFARDPRKISDPPANAKVVRGGG